MDSYVKQLHKKAFVADLHADTLIWSTLIGFDLANRHLSFPVNLIRNHVDAHRLKKGGVNLQFFGLTNNYVYKPKQAADDMIDSLEKAVKKSKHLTWALNGLEAQNAYVLDKVGVTLAMQGVHQLEGDLDNVEHFYKRGVRSIGLAHFPCSEAACSNLYDHPNNGLKPVGEDLIKIMNDLGMIVDLAHVSEPAAYQAIEVSEQPVMISHTACRSLRNISRNTSDDLIKAVAQGGGIIGIMYQRPFLSKNPVAGVDVIGDHIDHICELVGPEYVSLGSDFDGFIVPPIGMRDTRDVIKITNDVVRRGYPKDAIEKILGRNVLNLYERICG